MKLILNERREIGDMIRQNRVPDHFSKRYLITLLAGYYRGEADSAKGLEALVRDQMARFPFTVTEYQEYLWQPFLSQACKKAYQGEFPLRELDSVPLCKRELAHIMACGTDRQRKVLFTLYIIARFMDTGGWVNLSWAELFKRANVSVTVDRQIELIRDLVDRGLLSLSTANDNLNLRVHQESPDETVMEVTSLEFLGNQFIARFKEGCRQCECCGKVIHVTSNRMKYCKKCSEAIHREKQRKSMRLLRESG